MYLLFYHLHPPLTQRPIKERPEGHLCVTTTHCGPSLVVTPHKKAFLHCVSAAHHSPHYTEGDFLHSVPHTDLMEAHRIVTTLASPLAPACPGLHPSLTLWGLQHKPPWIKALPYI